MTKRDQRAKASALSMGQHVAIASTQMLFGAITGAIRLVRGERPQGWRTLRYGLHREEVLDYIAPRERLRAKGKSDHAPVVFFHGGGWMMGTKDFYSHDLLFLAQAGYPVFNVEYPKAPDHPHPWLLRSIFKSLVFIRSFPEAQAVHLMGDSAGGNLAVMVGILANDPKLLADVDPTLDASELPTILSTTSIYGVMDRLACLKPGIPVGATMIEAYGGPAALETKVDAAHAITPMDLTFSKHPPCFLMCGEWDPLLPSTQAYAERLTQAGHAVKSTVYQKATHGFFNFPDNAVKAGSRHDILAFLKEIERETA